MSADEPTVVSAPGGTDPDVAALTDALADLVDAAGAVPAGVTTRLVRDHGWRGRTVDVLAALTEDTERMGYLA